MPRRLRFLAACLCLIGIDFAGKSMATEPKPAVGYVADIDEVDPYHPGRNFPKLITPRWVGEPGVEAVVVLAIDDMRDPAKYETYLRPILNRLKAIDGRRR